MWAMTIAIFGGVGLFLLGMSVMTEGLKAMAGSALRSVLAKAAATPLRGTFWGAFVTLLVQSSSATTMTTIGLVSAGLLTFPQGLSLVFGASIGTTGTGWLVALIGVRVSLTAWAMPMVFAGAMMRLLGKGRLAGGGNALAGFGLLLAGLTTLQQGMGVLSDRLNPSDLPAVLGAAGVGFWAGVGGLLLLVVVGVVMTTVMQSSSAAIAVSLSALYAGAIGPDQAVALVIGQNVGTAVSSALAAIGTTTPAKRTAVAYILFKVTTACVAVLLFPLTSPLVNWASQHVDDTTMLAAYHTLYNVVGVSLLLPVVGRFAGLVEWLVPQRGPVLTKYLDRSVQTVPAVAVEASRRTVGAVLESVCRSVVAGLSPPSGGLGPQAAGVNPEGAAVRVRLGADEVVLIRSTEALDRTRAFLAGLTEPPVSSDEQRRLTGTLHALDHAVRLIETLQEEPGDPYLPTGETEVAAVRLAQQALGEAVRLGHDIASETETEDEASAARLDRWATELAELRRQHRAATLEQAGRAGLNAAEAMQRVDWVRRLDRVVYHVSRIATHLRVG